MDGDLCGVSVVALADAEHTYSPHIVGGAGRHPIENATGDPWLWAWHYIPRLPVPMGGEAVAVPQTYGPHVVGGDRRD